MADWRIEDIKTLIYNELNELIPIEKRSEHFKMHYINRKVKTIRKQQKCDEYTALKIFRQVVASEVKNLRAKS